MLKEMRLHVARIGREDGSRGAPCRWVRVLCSDVGGNSISEETPHGNPTVVPQMSEYTSCSDVEIVPITLRISVEKCAATISAVGACTCSANQVG